MTTRQAYPSDVSDDEWAFVAPYLTLMREDVPQREHSLREIFNGARWVVRAGADWRATTNDSQKLCPAFMSWPSPYSCYDVSSN